ncbi:hypothetical protein vBSlqSZDD2_47 [Serratia phage vB_SlqS_ZDD2]|nr:hypothetical protein vBSlqSZDD2_47 [Serratia phage vB_SlqS_ZDD2]
MKRLIAAALLAMAPLAAMADTCDDIVDYVQEFAPAAYNQERLDGIDRDTLLGICDLGIDARLKKFSRERWDGMLREDNEKALLQLGTSDQVKAQALAYALAGRLGYAEGVK